MTDAQESFRRKQALFLDALEESFGFARIAYARLVSMLAEVDPSNGSPQPSILDAWVIIDVAKRLRSLIESTPGLKRNEAVTRFLSETARVPDFRHYVQHLDRQPRDVAPTGYPIWGSLSWAIMQAPNSCRMHMYAPGRLAKVKGLHIVNPVGRTFHSPLDHVELALWDGAVINLSELVRTIGAFGDSFTKTVAAAEAAGHRDANGLLRLVLAEGT